MTIIANNIAENLCKKDRRDFWKDIKHLTNKKVKLPTNIDGVHGDNDIVSMWKQLYLIVLKKVAVIKLTVISVIRTWHLTVV